MATITKIVDPNGGGDYTSISAWQAGERTLHGSGDIVIASCRRTGATLDTTTVAITGWNAGVIPQIIVEPAYRHEGKFQNQNSLGNYVYTLRSTSDWTAGLTVSTAGTVIEGLQIEMTAANSSALVLSANSTTIVAVSCVLKAGSNGITMGSYGQGGYKIRNCFAYNCTRGFNDGRGDNDAGRRINLDNCVSYGASVAGIDAGYGMIVYNCISLASGTTDFVSSNSYAGGADNNISSDSTAPGTTNGRNKTSYTDYFVDIANGDPHLLGPSAAVLGVTGTDLSVRFTTDIDSETRGTWDVGCDEYVNLGNLKLITTISNTVIAAGSGATGWSARCLFEVSGDLYMAAQDTGGSPRVRVYRSTDDGATWYEQDAANAPTVHDGSYSWSSGKKRDGTSLFATRSTSATNRWLREFTFASNTWAASDYNEFYDVDSASPVRLMHFDFYGSLLVNVVYSSSADTTDLRSSAGTGAVSGTSDSRSIVLDAHVVWDEWEEWDQIIRINGQTSVLDAVSTTWGPSAFDTTVATSDAGHAPATFEPYLVSDAVTVTVAYIDADNTINERAVNLSAGAVPGTQYQVTASTAYAGGKVSTCRYDGDRYVFASKADGTSIDYWVFSGGSWSSGGNVATGSGLHLAQALPVEGAGILIAYNSGSDVIIGWAIDGPDEPEPAETTEFFYAQII